MPTPSMRAAAPVFKGGVTPLVLVGAVPVGLSAGVEGVPAGVEGVPAGEEGVPAGEEGVPAGVEGVPAGVEDVPAGVEGVPAGVEGVPAGVEAPEAAGLELPPPPPEVPELTVPPTGPLPLGGVVLEALFAAAE